MHRPDALKNDAMSKQVLAKSRAIVGLLLPLLLRVPVRHGTMRACGRFEQ